MEEMEMQDSGSTHQLSLELSFTPKKTEPGPLQTKRTEPETVIDTPPPEEVNYQTAAEQMGNGTPKYP